MVDLKEEVKLSKERCPTCGAFLEVAQPLDKDAKEIYCAACGNFKAVEIK